MSGRKDTAAGQVLVEIADQVAAVTLDRPPVNALSSGFYAEIGVLTEAGVVRQAAPEAAA